MKSLLKIFTILIFGIAFNIQASFAFRHQSIVNAKQEYKRIAHTESNAALLEHSRILTPVHSETLPISSPALFTIICSISFASFTSAIIQQKKLKLLRQRWLWLILFPFHSFY